MILAEFFIPHGHCYLWKPGLVGLHVVSDALTALAYYSIPLTLTYFVAIYGLALGQATPTLTEHGQKIHPDDKTVWDRAVNQITGGKSCQLEFRIVRPDGSIRHLFGQGEPIFNADGQVDKLFGTVGDITDRVAAQARERLFGAIALSVHQSLELDEILNTTVTEVRQLLQTERREAEEKLRKSEANLATAQRVAHVGNWEFDVLTQEITWSEELFRIFGLDPTEPEPTFDEHLQQIHPDDRALWQEVVGQGKSD